MNRILLGVLASCLPAACSVALCSPRVDADAQSAGQVPARKKGAIFKDEVDGLIDVLTDRSRAAKTPLGGDSALATAKVLAAMARCHRRYYYPGDVPAVTSSAGALLRARRQDGSFGDAVTTAWVADALSALPLEPVFAEEVRAAREWLRQQGDATPVFDALVTGVLAEVRADRFPQQLAGDAAAKAKAWQASAEGLIHDEAADALVRLVACQAANRALDRAQDPRADAPAPAWSPAQQKAYAWLSSQQQDGVFSLTMGGKTFPDPAFTGFGLLALQTKPKALRTVDEQATIDKGLRWLLAGQNEDGTFGQQVQNYTTCVVVGALTKWGDATIEPALQKAQRAILGFQNSEAGGYQRSDRDYGSIGYGNSQRGDLSNLHFSLEALRATGLPADHEAFGKALVFLQRTQNLKSVNDFTGKVSDPDREGVVLDATSGDDGGASYYPGNSAAGYLVLPDGKSVARSYGSMTYALLKSYLLAGVPGDDPRVQAAVQWIRQNWTLAVNPGADPALGEKVQHQGLYYYYLVLAQALDAAQVVTVDVARKDDKGVDVVEKIDWRQALRAHLEGAQQADGTWVNGKNDRWMEGLPLLCTCYAMAALEHCR
jgi:squalene-hopene/tetraprenyl-beta-curcumene cyclase